MQNPTVAALYIGNGGPKLLAGKGDFDPDTPWKKNYSSTIHFTHCHFSGAENCTVVNLGHKLCVLKAVKAGQMGGNLEQHTEEVHTRPHSMHYFTTFDV